MSEFQWVFWGSVDVGWSQVCNRFAAALAILCALVWWPGDGYPAG